MNVRAKATTENPAGSPKVTGRPKSGEFKDFEALTRKLVNVPKDEIDEKRRNES